VDLEAAQFTIDILEMIEAKTAGNLDSDEQRLLKDTLSSLRLNYVETARDEKEAGGVDKQDSGEGQAAG
jgi:hypothetical protein